jgi:hypothetical protein
MRTLATCLALAEKMTTAKIPAKTQQGSKGKAPPPIKVVASTKPPHR